MNAIQNDLLKFFINFIQNSKHDEETSNYLVKKMMKNKSVQEIIADCLFRLEPVLTTELTLIKNNKKPAPTPIQKESRLLLLAQDIKNLMNNFESIKSAIGSISKTVNRFGNFLNQNTLTSFTSSQSFDSPLVQYLYSMSTEKSITYNEEFQEFTEETWNKHMEVEKMLAAELYLYKTRWDLLEEKNARKLFWVKEKAGGKVKRLEELNEKIRFEFIRELARVEMKLEDRVGMDERRRKFEIEIMKDEENTVFVPDLLSAVEKIKSLLTVRQVLEFNRQEDDKVIQVLNDRMQGIAFDFLETQEKLKTYVKYTQDLANLLVKVIQKFSWPKDKVKEVMDCAVKMEFNEMDKMIMSLMNECSTNFSMEIKSRSPDSPRKLNRNRKSPKSKMKIITSPLHNASKDPENSSISFKKVLKHIDMEIKSKNKKFSENLSEILNNSSNLPKIKQKEIIIKSNQNESQVDKKKTFSEFAVQTMTTFKVIRKKESTTQTFNPLVVNNESQTELRIVDIQELEDFKKSRDNIQDIINQNSFITTVEQSSKETQTEQKKIFYDFDNSKVLMRSMMRKHALPSHHLLLKSKTPLPNPNDFSSVGNQLLKSLEPATLLSQNTTNIEDETIEEQLVKATAEYSKEFGIFSQFLGYKKLDFTSIQKLWEEVINRRLSEGEKDKITLYLKEYEGCENYEFEKMKIIHLLMNLKKQGKDDEAFENLVKGFKKKMRILSKWRKFFILFFKKNSKKLIYDKDSDKVLDFYKIVEFYRIIKQDISLMLDKKHLMKKSETSVVFKDENWINTSRSPTLLKKTIVKSRIFNIKHNKSYERTLRIRSPAQLHLLKELNKLPNISNIIHLKLK